MTTTYTPALRLGVPTPFDPLVRNLWGGILNNDLGILDTAVAQVLSKDVTGSVNIVLASADGVASESDYAHYVLTGAIGANVQVLWPQNQQRMFSVHNGTSGGFTLSAGANNGSGSNAGAVIAIPQGSTFLLASDGVNVIQRLILPVSSEYGVDTGAANAAVVALPVAPVAYVDGLTVLFSPVATNTSANVTINVNGLGAKAITGPGGSALAIGALAAGTLYQISYLGTGFQMGPATPGRLLNIQVFNTAGTSTYNASPGTASILVAGQGGGAQGGGAGSTGAGQAALGSGGDAGAYGEAYYTTGFTGGLTVTVGAKGSGAASGANNGNNGGSTTFGTLMTCPGGTGGLGGTAQSPPFVTTPAHSPAVATFTGASKVVLPGSTALGGSGMALSSSVGLSGAGGPSQFGAGAYGRAGSNDGIAATTPGGGGGGAAAFASSPSGQGAVGADGFVVVYEYS